MKFTADTLIITGMALSVAVLLGLLISVWRGVAARRALREDRRLLQERESELLAWLDVLRVSLFHPTL